MSIIEKAMEKARLAAEEGNKVIPSLSKSPTPPQLPLKESSKSVHVTPAPELIMADPTRYNLGGEYRLLKETLLALRKEQPNANMFMVTSAMRNEGKTVVSCNLAATLAHEFDHTVLLMDADLRAPSCHGMFGLQRPRGLSDCLLHNVPFSDVLIRTDLGRLSLLGAGSSITNPAELFTSNLMRDFLQEIKQRYPDRITIIDSAPLLPFSETRALSRIVDGIILVVRENVTAKSHLDSALKTLDGCPLLGVAYNDASSYGSDKEIFDLPGAY